MGNFWRSGQYFGRTDCRGAPVTDAVEGNQTICETVYNILEKRRWLFENGFKEKIIETALKVGPSVS